MKKKMTIKLYIEATVFAGLILSPIGIIVGLIFGWKWGIIAWLIPLFTNMISGLKLLSQPKGELKR